jgi:hypothetical protein
LRGEEAEADGGCRVNFFIDIKMRRKMGHFWRLPKNNNKLVRKINKVIFINIKKLIILIN